MHVTITGLGRGGTSIMGQVFSKHPRVEFRHERSGTWLAQHLGIPLMGRLEPECATEAMKARARAWAQPKDCNKLLVEKDPRHVHRLGFLRRLWPEAKFIYMVRDPRDLACSALKGIRKKHKAPEQWLVERGPAMAEQLRPLPPLLRIVAWWQHVVLHDLKDMQLDDAFTVVRYEDFLHGTEQHVQHLFDWVGLDVHQRVAKFLPKVSDDPSVHVSPLSAGNFVPGHARRVGRWRSEWAEEDARAAWDFAGETMAALGYAEE